MFGKSDSRSCAALDTLSPLGLRLTRGKEEAGAIEVFGLQIPRSLLSSSSLTSIETNVLRTVSPSPTDSGGSCASVVCSALFGQDTLRDNPSAHSKYTGCGNEKSVSEKR